MKISKKEIFFISLTLFSMFFGAGNLIFPPILGKDAGSNLPLVFIMFCISGIVLPIVAVVIIAKSKGILNLGSRVNKNFAFLFALAVFLTIGPFLAIPRNASLPFELVVAPHIAKATSFNFPLLLYSILFFSVAFYLALNPKKIVDRLGKLMSPILIILILLLFIKAIFTPLGNINIPAELMQKNPLSTGFLKGYETLDVLAALNYGIVVLFVFKNKQVEETKLIKATTIAGIIAGIILAIIYLMLSYLGATSHFDNINNGAQLLLQISYTLYGDFGTIIISVIFTIACMSVCVGLLTSCSEYFAENFPKISYKIWLCIFIIISFFFTNYGLDNILTYSIPILLLIYPLALVLIILALLEKIIGHDKIIYTSCIIVTFVMSIFDVFPNLKQQFHLEVLNSVPFANIKFLWLIPFIITLIITYILRFFYLKQKNIILSKQRNIEKLK